MDSGRLGRKAGDGVYTAGLVPEPPFAEPGPVPKQIHVASRGGTSVRLFREAGLVCTETDDLPYGVVDIDGIRLAMTDGRPLSERDDVDALADCARNFASAGTIAITARDAQAEAVVAGFVQATGRSALILPDRPGMIVLRTLAQLANAAADAVTDEVASSDGIDEAMVYGANHPEGPLLWAARTGKARVARALRHIAQTTGDSMYEPAPLLAAA